MCFIVGFCAATIRTNCVRTPAFPKELLDTTIRGVIESIEDVPRGTPERQRIIRRIILADIKLPSKASNSPKLRDALNSKGIKIRLQGTLKKLNKVGLFSRITLRAHIFPPPFPLTLHGYDAPFDAYFKGISAFGKLKEVHKCANDEPPQNTPLNTASATNSITQSTHSIQKIRFALKQRIETFLNPRTAPIANALIVGDKSGITLRSRENFTKSGLSHILAISGLHMGLLSLMIFFMLSKVLALVPNLAEMFPVKKLSALLTIPVALFYLLLSGGSFSAMRSFIMVCISMIAILVDENPISLHCIAIAALIILLLYPESLYSISFQLSFASVFGLCSFHEKFQNAYWGSKSAVLAKLFRVLNPIQQSILSTFIATIATAPIIVYSFQRFTFVGAIGNLLAIPLLSFFIMPVGILATISLIWGGSGLLFRMFNISLDMLINITERVASLPFSDCLFAKPSCVSVILIILSIIWLVVWNESKRLWSIPFLLLGLVLFFMTTSPSIFITHNVIGISPNVRRDDGFSIGANDSRKFLISSRRFGGFHAKVWAQECGLKDIDEMTEEQVEYWQERLEKAQNSIAEDEVIFMWQDRHGRFSAKTLSFVGKNRPWYALARKD
ncbi:MAG: ComEC/Rec2 family competence protein [Holosporales bacterium]|jgi:competence protein ComEC|nr:ComEC/Rec2 family competence protein [Holosporales bacterium]